MGLPDVVNSRKQSREDVIFRDLDWTPEQPLVPLGGNPSTELNEWDKDAICFPNEVKKSNLIKEVKEEGREGPNLTETICRTGGLGL